MRLLTVPLALMLATPAHAAATAWQDLAPDTRIRLIASERAGPTTQIAIELDMPPGTRTYWRVPGETGIPLELDLSGSTGIAGHRVLWPFPEIEIREGYTDFVLSGPTVIPIELDLEEVPARVEASVLLGVCSDICVPATASFSLPLDLAKPDAEQAIRIDQALARTSIEWDGPEAPVGNAVVAAEGTLEVTVDPARLDPASLIVDASESGYVFGAPQKSPEPNVLAYRVAGGGDAGALVGKAIRLVFMTRDGPYEVSRTVGPSGRD